MTTHGLTHLPRLRTRPLRAHDLPECLKLLPPYLSFDAAGRERVARWWAQEVDSPGMISGVMEDMALPPGQRIQGWGVSIIAPAALVERFELLGTPRAHLTQRAYHALTEGGVALLDDREIARQNARGELVLLVLHFTLQRGNADFTDPYAQKVIALANDGFRAFHDGYQWRTMVFENSAATTAVAVQSGFHPTRFADEDTLDGLPLAQRPALFVLTREQARRTMPGSPARNAFEWQPPHFRFNAAQRRLLTNALFDENDEALMALLGVSTHGLKKLWRGIYERIDDVEPEFFGDAGAADDGKRGPEKRRQVLAYVRQRLEELRPWMPA
jgi:hypothetical protein